MLRHTLLSLISFFAAVIFVPATSPVYAEVFDLSAIINQAQSVPLSTGTPASAAGFGSVQFDDVTKQLSWDIAWQDLSGPATAMHFHAPASPGTAAGVAVNIGGVSGLSSPSIGSTIVDDTFAANLLSGQSYINIHTAQNGPGEVRGQVNPSNINFFTTLDPSQANPTPSGVPAGAGGTAHVALDPTTNTLGWNIAWSDLSGPATAMHFHGPAELGQNAGVKVNIGGTSGLTSPSIGSTVISDEFESQLLGGLWYINIHTALNGAGEIRGQLVPEPSSAALLLLALLGMSQIRTRRRS